MNPKPLVSKQTLNEFREYMVGWVLRKIDMEFQAAEIDLDDAYAPPVTGERRFRVEQYYKTLELSNPDSVRRVLQVFQTVLHEIEESMKYSTFGGPKETQERQFNTLQRFLKKDGFLYENGEISQVGHLPTVSQMKSVAVQFDLPYLLQQIKRIETSADSDPGFAIGTAKELVESTCKTILMERGKPVDPSWDLMALCKHTRAELKLVPDNIPDAAKAADTIKRLLNNLGTIVQGLGELRNAYGTGHGQHGKAKGLQPRHARLAAGAASSLAQFLYQTHKDSGS